MIERGRWWIKRLTGSRILRASSAMMVASYASMGIGMLTGILVARLLGDVRYGLILTAIAVVNTIIQFMDIRTSEALIRFMGNALTRNDRPEAWAYFLVGLTADFLLMLATLALAVLLVPVVLRVYPDQEALRPLVAIFIFTIPFTGFQGTFSSLLHVFKRFTWLAAATVLNSVILFICLVIAIPNSINAVMWAYVITSGLVFTVWLTLGLRLLFTNMPLRDGFATWAGYREAWREFIPFTFHTSLTQSLKAISVNLDTLVLGALRPIEEVAYFRIGRSASALIGMPTAPVKTVIYPELNEAWAKNDLATARRLTRRFTWLSLVVGVPILIGLGLFGVFLVRLIYGSEYAAAAPAITQVMVIMGLGIVVDSMFRWVRPAAMAQNKPQLITFVTIFNIIIRSGLMIPLIYLTGLLGGAIAYTVTVIIAALFYLLYVSPRLGLWAPLGIGRTQMERVIAEQAAMQDAS